MFAEGFHRYLNFNLGLHEALEDLMDSVTLKHQVLQCFLSLGQLYNLKFMNNDSQANEFYFKRLKKISLL